MKQNILQNVIKFIMRYIWLFCLILIILELFSVTYTANILMRQSAVGVIQSVSGEVSGRVDGILRLLKGLSTDERFSDTSKSLFERVTHAMPYQESYNLYMIAMTDENVNVVSADEKSEPTEQFSLAYRDYMQRLYATGEVQITDAFISGDNKNTLNYTIAVPIMQDNLVKGSIFGSIYFNDIEEILSKHSLNDGRKFYLFGNQNTIMAGEAGTLYGKSFLNLSKGSFLFGKNINSIDEAMKTRKSGDFWEWDSEGLAYVTFQNVEPSNWTLLYRVQFMSVFTKLLPTLLVKICFYILMCGAIYFLGRRYLSKHLSKVNHLLNRMAEIQKELFVTEQPDYEKILDLTEQGLTDHLTGLATRTVLFKKMIDLTTVSNAYGAIVFIDLDDLKHINDNFGHEGGDYALMHCGKILKEYEERYNGVASRYGGDEFVLLLNAVKENEATEISQKLCEDLNVTINLKGRAFSIHGSLGVSFYPNNGTKPEELICKADLALYSAKQEGKNRCAFYREEGSVL